MLVAVTGATGFIGAPLVRRLVARGDRVRVMARPTSDLSAFEGLDVEVVRGDLFDSASMRRLCAGADALFHLAADLSFWQGVAAEQDRINVEGTRRAMDAARAGGVGRVIHTSSVAAIGIPADRDRPADESNPFSGWQYTYFRTKKLAEDQAFRAVDEHGLDVVAVNPGTVFGGAVARRRSGSQRIIGMVAKGAPIPLLGRLRVYPPGGYNLCDVDDVVAGHLLALEKGRTRERYILGGHNLSLRAVFTEIARQLGVPPPKPIPGPALLAVGWLSEVVASVTGKMPQVTWDYARLGTMRLFYDSSKAIRELGYPITPWEETIAKGVASWRAAERARPDAG